MKSTADDADMTYELIRYYKRVITQNMNLTCYSKFQAMIIWSFGGVLKTDCYDKKVGLVRFFVQFPMSGWRIFLLHEYSSWHPAAY
jgi:hypothetical protein